MADENEDNDDFIYGCMPDGEDDDDADAEANEGSDDIS